MRLPEVVSLVLCRAFEVNPANGQASLVGIFQVLVFRDWPPPVQRFTAYTTLLGGEGEGTIELAVHRLEEEQLIYRYRRWVTLPGPGQFFNVVIPVTRCVFPSPGRYTVTLYFDDYVLSTRTLELFLV